MEIGGMTEINDTLLKNYCSYMVVSVPGRIRVKTRNTMDVALVPAPCHELTCVPLGLFQALVILIGMF